MNARTNVDGHRVPGCDGAWIDVGTLHEPRKQLCGACRGTRQRPLVDDEDLPAPALTDVLGVAGRRSAPNLLALRYELQALDPVVMDETDGKWWYFDAEPPYQFGPFDYEEDARIAMRNHVGLGEDARSPRYSSGMEMLAYFLIGVALASGVAYAIWQLQ